MSSGGLRGTFFVVFEYDYVQPNQYQTPSWCQWCHCRVRVGRRPASVGSMRVRHRQNRHRDRVRVRGLASVGVCKGSGGEGAPGDVCLSLITLGLFVSLFVNR